MSENLTILDWRTLKHVEFPCPVCKADMKKTMEFPLQNIYECQVGGCTGRMALPKDQKAREY